MILRSALLFLAAQTAFAFATLTPESARAFDRYIELTEARMNRDRQAPVGGGEEARARLRGGEALVESRKTLDEGKPIKTPGGMIQDWLGTMFMPGASIDRVKTVLQDYANYKNYYKPDVIDSKLVAHHGDDYDIFLRLYKKQFLTVVLNTNYHVRYSLPGDRRMYVASRSTRVAEVKNWKRSLTDEEPIGNDTGFLWRLHSYWRFEEADAGVYAECEAISLSRDIPFGLGWLKGFLQKFPKESMQNTLRGTKAAVEAGH